MSSCILTSLYNYNALFLCWLYLIGLIIRCIFADLLVWCLLSLLFELLTILSLILVVLIENFFALLWLLGFTRFETHEVDYVILLNTLLTLTVYQIDLVLAILVLCLLFLLSKTQIVCNLILKKLWVLSACNYTHI